jgi:hypothetical protein
VSLLEDIRQIAAAVAPGESPEHGEIASVVGALIKVLDDAGVKAGPDVLAEAKARTVTAPAAPAATVAAAESKFAGMLERLEAALQVIEGKDTAEPTKPSTS